MAIVNEPKVSKALGGMLDLYPAFSNFSINPMLSGTIDLSELLGDYVAVGYSVAINNTGAFKIVEVPKGERWRLLSATLGILSGTYTFKKLYFVRGNTGADLEVLATAAAELFSYFGGQRFWLKEGDNLYLYVDAKTVNGNAAVSLYYQEVPF
jgi:hypothetical protein